MNFSILVDDLKKLEGMHLDSIRPGAGITITKVDLQEEKLVVVSDKGKAQSRPFSQFRTIWEQLLLHPAIHVDEVLHGSGTSRNQPETIFANLPYIEWLKINGKKHISYVKNQSHPYGTLKLMDNFRAASVMEQMQSDNAAQVVAAIVSSNPVETIGELQKISAGNVHSLSQGIYFYESSGTRLLVITYASDMLPCGYYPIVNFCLPSISQEQKIAIFDKEYILTSIQGYRILIPCVE